MGDTWPHTGALRGGGFMQKSRPQIPLEAKTETSPVSPSQNERRRPALVEFMNSQGCFQAFWGCPSFVPAITHRPPQVLPEVPALSAPKDPNTCLRTQHSFPQFSPHQGLSFLKPQPFLVLPLCESCLEIRRTQATDLVPKRNRESGNWA